jgi:hypothetical protein
VGFTHKQDVASHSSSKVLPPPDRPVRGRKMGKGKDGKGRAVELGDELHRMLEGTFRSLLKLRSEF